MPRNSGITITRPSSTIDSDDPQDGETYDLLLADDKRAGIRLGTYTDEQVAQVREDVEAALSQFDANLV